MNDSASVWPFAEAAAYYDAHRPPYAPEALNFVARMFGIGPGVRVLDLGCGPGTLAVPLSRLGARVTAVDPDPAMLSEARRIANLRDAGEITWLQCRAEEVPAQVDAFSLVTFGQSLHWMDRDLVLSRLPSLLDEGGGLAIFDEPRDAAPESWSRLAAQVVGRYLGRPARHPLKHPESAHEPALLRSSAFAEFEQRRFAVEFVRDPTSILGCIYSGVHSTKSAFGDRLPAFEAELLEVLHKASPDGCFRERTETAVWVARKPISPPSQQGLLPAPA